MEDTKTCPKAKKATLLSLHDEPLHKVFHYLGASKTNLNLLAPRQAFSLAITNRSLLNLFRTMLTNLRPDVDPRNSSAITPMHLLSIARLAGEHLREIHVPVGSPCILSGLSKICPNLKYLRIVQGDHEVLDSGLSDVLNLPLRKLSINNASHHALRFITSVPEDLTLTHITQDCFEHLKRLLKTPPKILCLSFFIPNGNTHILPGLQLMLESIKEACPRVVSLTVRVQPDIRLDFLDFIGLASKHISELRKNSEASQCKTVLLAGKATFPILKKAHPEAVVSLKSGQIEFGDEGDGMFVRSLVVVDDFLLLELDYSRLHSVYVLGYTISPRWKEKLYGLKLNYAWVHNFQSAADLCMNVNLMNVDEPLSTVNIGPSANWEWLSKVNQLELRAPRASMSSAELTKCFKGLNKIMEIFRGDVVWIDNYGPVRLLNNIDVPLVEAGKELLSSIERFEECGGDGKCVKLIVMDTLEELVRS